MKFSFIDISELFQNQHRIIGIYPHNRYIFYILPGICGIVCSLLFYKDTKDIMEVLTLFISIFIPIFISLLATMISFVMNKIVTRHNKERIPLIKETFYTICYLIPISLALLILSLFMHLTLWKDVILWKTVVLWEGHILWQDFSLNQLIIMILGIAFYGGIAHLMLNLLMVTKRIFKLFDKEIDLLTTDKAPLIPDSKKEKDIVDANALEGEE